MIDPTAWRDVDSVAPQIGLVINRHGLSAYVARRCYRVRWTGPWTRCAPDEANEADLLLDEHDQAFYGEAFVLADAVRRFLARQSTRQVIDAGMLDDDAVRDLIESADRIWLIRTQRVGAARATGVAAAADTAVSGRSEHRSPTGYVAPGPDSESDEP